MTSVRSFAVAPVDLLSRSLGWLAFLMLVVGAVRVHAGLPETVERTKPSVVAIGTFEKTRSPSFVFRGTGFAVDDGTLIATNAHVVPEILQPESREAIVVLVPVSGGANPQEREARVVAIDREHDLALLRISGARLPVLTLGGADGGREGQSVAFTGFPLGNALGFHPVTHRAIISARTPIAIPGATAQQLDPRIVRSLKSGPFTVYQIDTSVYPGHSGSPLYDVDSGEVLGIVNMGFVKGTKDAALGQPSGIGVAVPAQFLQELIRHAR